MNPTNSTTKYQSRKKASEWQKIIDHFKQSNLSQADYAKKHGLSSHQISYWFNKLKGAQPSKFIAVKPQATMSIKPIVIKLSNGAQIECHDDSDFQLIKRLLEALS